MSVREVAVRHARRLKGIIDTTSAIVAVGAGAVVGFSSSVIGSIGALFSAQSHVAQENATISDAISGGLATPKVFAGTPEEHGGGGGGESCGCSVGGACGDCGSCG